MIQIYVKNSEFFRKYLFYCMFISKRNLMINDANIQCWTLLNRVANIICLMCIECMFDKNHNSEVARRANGNCHTIKIRGWHIWLLIGEACTFPDNDVRSHYAFDNIVLSSEKFVASASRVSAQ